MSTFFGGEQLVNTLELRGSSVFGSVDVYTVPSGRYAHVFINMVEFNGTGSEGINVNYAGASEVELKGSGDIENFEQRIEILLSEGDLLKLFAFSSGSYSIFVKEFKKP